MKTHTPTSMPAAAACQPDAVRAKVRQVLFQAQQYLMPPRMEPRAGCLTMPEMVRLNTSIITCCIRPEGYEGQESQLIWRRYTTWRGFFRHIVRHGFPALYVRRH